MKLKLLGTTGYHPNERRQTACMMLPEIGVVLDAGTAMFRVRDHLVTPHLDIFLTHAHLDHVVGLTFLFDVLYEKEMQRVSVRGDAAKLKALQEHLFAEDLFPIQPPFDWEPLDGAVTLSDGGRVTYFPLEHPGGSLGYRIDWPDHSMAYVTDTCADPAADYVERIRGVDVLLHECYFPDEWKDHARLTGHSWTSAVAETALAAEVGQLILVHINPLSADDDPVGLAQARAIFSSTELAYDGMEVDI